MYSKQQTKPPDLKGLGALLAFAAIIVAILFNLARKKADGVSSIGRLENVGRVELNISPKINYGLDLTKEQFYIWLPPPGDSTKPYGLVVYQSPQNLVTDPPPGWSEVLSKRNLIFIAPENAGNDCPPVRRLGLAVLGALSMIEKYSIDRHRIYSAGLSGGARSAGDVAFCQPDLFSGTIQSCGSDFCKQVPRVFAKDEIDTIGKPYGFFAVPEASRFKAWQNVRFVLVTGPNDFRYGNILDIYKYGFQPDGYKCLLLDVPNMGHVDCSGESLSKALDFIEAAKP